MRGRLFMEKMLGWVMSNSGLGSAKTSSGISESLPEEYTCPLMGNTLTLEVVGGCLDGVHIPLTYNPSQSVWYGMEGGQILAGEGCVEYPLYAVGIATCVDLVTQDRFLVNISAFQWTGAGSPVFPGPGIPPWQVSPWWSSCFAFSWTESFPFASPLLEEHSAPFGVSAGAGCDGCCPDHFGVKIRLTE